MPECRSLALWIPALVDLSLLAYSQDTLQLDSSSASCGYYLSEQRVLYTPEIAESQGKFGKSSKESPFLRIFDIMGTGDKPFSDNIPSLASLPAFVGWAGPVDQNRLLSRCEVRKRLDK